MKHNFKNPNGNIGVHKSIERIDFSVLQLTHFDHFEDLVEQKKYPDFFVVQNDPL